MLVYSFAALICGFILLTWAADRFVLGAASTARILGVSPLMVGLTIVGFGTSAPEILVSIVASFEGNPQIAVGNAIGSNITNIALVLGTTALITPIAVRSKIIRHEIPALIGAMLFGFALVWDGELSFIDGVLLLSALVVVGSWIVYTGLKESGNKDALEEETAEEIPDTGSLSGAIGWTVFGMIGLIASSKILVWGAVNIASHFGVSDLIIGLTIVALGTSLPELAASIASARKNEPDIALGNIIGSNLFNLLAVMAMPALVAPGVLEPEVISRDFPYMLVLTLALFLMAFGFKRQGRINRYEGTTLLLAFVAYQYLLFTSVV